MSTSSLPSSLSWNEYSLFWFHSAKIALPSQYAGHLRSDARSAS